VLSDVPVVVLSAARSFPLPRRFRAHWTRLQAGLAAAAPDGRHLVVDGTGHNIPTHPDVVASTILAVAAQARASGGDDKTSRRGLLGASSPVPDSIRSWTHQQVIGPTLRPRWC
jgi:hypothetical protein